MFHKYVALVLGGDKHWAYLILPYLAHFERKRRRLLKVRYLIEYYWIMHKMNDYTECNTMKSTTNV